MTKRIIGPFVPSIDRERKEWENVLYLNPLKLYQWMVEYLQGLGPVCRFSSWSSRYRYSLWFSDGFNSLYYDILYLNLHNIQQKPRNDPILLKSFIRA